VVPSAFVAVPPLLLKMISRKVGTSSPVPPACPPLSVVALLRAVRAGGGFHHLGLRRERERNGSVAWTSDDTAVQRRAADDASAVPGARYQMTTAGTVRLALTPAELMESATPSPLLLCQVELPLLPLYCYVRCVGRYVDRRRFNIDTVERQFRYYNVTACLLNGWNRSDRGD